MASVTDAKTGQPIYSTPGVGRNQVGAYQVSGRPWITGSSQLAANTEHTIQFPTIAKTVTVTRLDAHSGSMFVHFNSRDDGNIIGGLHYLPLNNISESWTVSVKCNAIYISAPAGGSPREYAVVASLTSIDNNNMYNLTGSGLTD
jgi:hypothetical protein|tara:strand:- start:1482 stop:1916 length:435 start_codon:yes stop_codon:yes gene_type:complete